MAAFAACGGGATKPDASFSAMYDLVSVNGVTPPAPMYNANCASQLTNAWLDVDHADSLLVYTNERSNPCYLSDPVPETDRLSYARDGTQIRITFPSPPFSRAWVDTGTISGDSVTIRYHV